MRRGSRMDPVRTDETHDVFHRGRTPLDPFFAPRNVAVIGATEEPGSVGRTVLWNLITSPCGVFPVSLTRESVLGIRAHRRVGDIPAPIDLAVVVTPARTVPGVIRECAARGIRAAIVISAGFKELGPPGEALEREVLAEARRGRMRILGPNCLGVMSPYTGLNATFAARMAKPGNVALLSQSGALLTAILDWSMRAEVGFSGLVSTGTMLDVSWGDLIDYFGDDPRTGAILLYAESITDVRAFVSAAREVALSKPILVLKGGRTEQAAAAATSHTGALAGADDVLDAVFRRAGVLRVDRISQLFHMAELLSKQPRPRGPRLTIVTNAGGPGVLATDALVATGGRLAALGEPARAALDEALPPAWSHGNPVDVLGDASAARYADALRILENDPETDGLLVVLTPQQMTDATRTAELVASLELGARKPILSSFMGGDAVEAARRILRRADIPTFDFPDTAARAFALMWSHSSSLEALYETPSLEASLDREIDARGARALVAATRAEGRTLLDERESKALLASYGIPTVATREASSADEAARHAEALGFPVVVKLASKIITHKTEVGGVELGLADAAAVRAAFERIRSNVGRAAGDEAFEGVTVQPMISARASYELLLGCSTDATFGPVVAFGAGGQLVEVMRDRALGLPPLTRVLARRLIERTRIAEALRGVRGRPPIDLDALEALLVRFSQLVADHRAIREIEINPLLASPERLIALDARAVLHPPGVAEAELPALAIRPYPREYVTRAKLRDGGVVTLRPIRPDDEQRVVELHENLSETTVRLRYFQPLPLGTRVAHERLVRICFADYDRDLPLVAVPEGAEGPILGVGRLSKLRWTEEGEFAVLVRDDQQRRGLGTALLSHVVAMARAEGLARLGADMLPENTVMQRIASQLGFRLIREREVVRAELDPRAPAVRRREETAPGP